MSRILIVGASIAILSRLVAAQGDPTELIYDTYLTEHTYMLSPPGLNWQAAQAYSRTLGGYLASINDEIEGVLIFARYQTHTEGLWIGLSDAQTEGTWVWDSGETIFGTNWCAGEPNNAGLGEDYAALLIGLGTWCWNDISSPYTGPNSAPTRAIIEIADGDRVSFDYNYPSNCTFVPSPLGAPGNPDGVSWNGAGNAAQHKAYFSRVNYLSWPVNGSGYLLVEANGPVQVPTGGPLPRPAPPVANEVRIPIPPGTKGVSYAWDLYVGETPFSLWNDGMSIAVIDANGHLIQNLEYADTSTIQTGSNVPSTSFCSTALVRPSHNGEVTSARLLPPLPFPAYLSIVCWNGSDNTQSSAALVDSIQFWGSSGFDLSISAPFGPGSFRLQNTNGVAGNGYVTAVTLAQGAFPNGWLFGLDIAPEDLFDQFASGPPFHGALNASGQSMFQIFTGVPPGIPVYAVSIQLTPGGSFVNASTPEFFLTQ